MLGKLIKRLRTPPPGWEAVKQHRTKLRPGLFIYAGGFIYRHWLHRIPQHLRVTKGRRRWIIPSMTAREQAQHLIRNAADLMQMRLFWVPKHPGHRFPFVISGSLNKCIFLDPSSRKVARPVQPDMLSSNDTYLRERWAKHIRTPKFHIATQEALLIEEYVQGKPIRSLPDAEQKRAYIRIVGDYSQLTRSEALEPDLTLLSALQSPAFLAGLDDNLRDKLESTALLSLLSEAPTTPTFSDSHEANVIVGEDGSCVFIDSFPPALKPFFYTPIYFLSRSPNLVFLRHSYFAGDFDAALTKLFEAANQTFNPTPTFRQSLIATAIVCRALPRMQIGATPEEHLAAIRRANWLFKKSGLSQSQAWSTHVWGAAKGRQ